MANPEHVAVLEKGTEAWNAWREANPTITPDFRHFDSQRSRLNETSPGRGSGDLSGANLRDSSFFQARLLGIDFARADLSGSDFHQASATFCGFSSANLSRTTFHHANLSNSKFDKANFQEASLFNAVFGKNDLSEILGVEASHYFGPIRISTETLYMTAIGLSKVPGNRGAIETFFRAAGVREPFIELIPLFIAQPISHYSCFISYSHDDKAFAKRLYDTLQGRGIRCWMDEKDLDLGAHFERRIDEAIRLQDKLIVCCSDSSTRRDWVELEVNKGEKREKEDPEAYPFLIPLDLDGSITQRPDSALAMRLSRRLAADFTGWETDNAKFEDQFERVVQALKTEKA